MKQRLLRLEYSGWIELKPDESLEKCAQKINVGPVRKILQANSPPIHRENR